MPVASNMENGFVPCALASARRGFTLIEVLVVVAILGILLAVGITVAPGMLASGRDTKCRANMGNLAKAFIQAGTDDKNHYPVAGSYQWVDTAVKNNDIIYRAHEKKGWIGWTSGNSYKSTPTAKQYQGVRAKPVQKNWHKSFSSEEDAVKAVTNGTLWAYTGQNLDMYVCPEHRRQHSDEFPSSNFGPGWSYAMNGYFKCDTKYGETRSVGDEGRRGIARDALTKPNKILLLAEIQALPEDETGLPRDFAKGPGRWETDCTLQYKGLANNWKSKGEIIGFNHLSGGIYHGNVAFADGHVEQIELPDKINTANLMDLTSWLCRGVDYSYNEQTGKYEKTNSDVD